MNCFHCRKAVDGTGRPGRGETCPFCGADVKVCLNCRFHDRNAYNECREPSAERVVDKSKANFCEFFEFKAQGEAQDAEDPLKKLKDLFK
ncbi:MAG: hypothetical protein HY954_04295 [Deltaproteobacteria bacterium]|nr:hypothetical protein [Deltaproteobacteria bacterium]